MSGNLELGCQSNLDLFVFSQEARDLAVDMRAGVVDSLSEPDQKPDQVHVVLFRPADLRFYYSDPTNLTLSKHYSNAFDNRNSKRWAQLVAPLDDIQVREYIAGLCKNTYGDIDELLYLWDSLNNLAALQKRFVDKRVLTDAIGRMLRYVGQEWDEGLCGHAFNSWIKTQRWETNHIPGYPGSIERRAGPHARTFCVMQRLEDMFGVYYQPTHAPEGDFFVAPVIQEGMVLGMVFAVYTHEPKRGRRRMRQGIIEMISDCLDAAVVEQAAGAAPKILTGRERLFFSEFGKAVESKPDAAILSLLAERMHWYVNASFVVLWQINQDHAYLVDCWGYQGGADLVEYGRMFVESPYTIHRNGYYRAVASPELFAMVSKCKSAEPVFDIPWSLTLSPFSAEFVGSYHKRAAGIDLAAQNWAFIPFFDRHTLYVLMVATLEPSHKRLARLAALLSVFEKTARSKQTEDWMDIAAAESHSIGNYALSANSKLELLRKGLEETSKALREGSESSVGLQTVCAKLDQFLIMADRCWNYNIYMSQYAEFFEEFAQTIRRGPGSHIPSETCDIVELVVNGFNDAKDCLLASYSVRQKNLLARTRSYEAHVVVGDNEPADIREIGDMEAPAFFRKPLLRFAFHELAKNSILNGTSPVTITVRQFEAGEMGIYYGVRWTNLPEGKLPDIDEMRRRLFSPRKFQGASLGCFLIHHFFRYYCGGDFDLVKSEYQKGYFSVEVRFPKELRRTAKYVEVEPNGQRRFDKRAV